MQIAENTLIGVLCIEAEEQYYLIAKKQIIENKKFHAAEYVEPLDSW